jgi:hypothetical protein
MVNIDGTINGNYMNGLTGYDFNTVWDDPDRDRQPEVYHIKQHLRSVAVRWCQSPCASCCAHTGNCWLHCSRPLTIGCWRALTCTRTVPSLACFCTAVQGTVHSLTVRTASHGTLPSSSQFWFFEVTVVVRSVPCCCGRLQ